MIALQLRHNTTTNNKTMPLQFICKCIQGLRNPVLQWKQDLYPVKDQLLASWFWVPCRLVRQNGPNGRFLDQKDCPCEGRDGEGSDPGQLNPSNLASSTREDRAVRLENGGNDCGGKKKEFAGRCASSSGRERPPCPQIGVIAHKARQKLISSSPLGLASSSSRYIERYPAAAAAMSNAVSAQLGGGGCLMWL